MYFDSTIILLIPAIIFSIIAQTGIKTTFGKYSRIKNMKRITGAEAARIVLEKDQCRHGWTAFFSQKRNDYPIITKILHRQIKKVWCGATNQR